MLKNLEGARLGLFIFLGTVLLVISIFLLGSKENLFTSTTEIRAYFGSIEGLKTGAPVRLSGYDVGSVSEISLASDTSGRVEVKMRINNDLLHFIRLDSEASIETEGLVGKKVVTITPGSPEQSLISENGVIKSKNPVNVSQIIEETQAVMSNLKIMTKDFAEIFAKINQGEGSVGKLINDDQLYYAAVNITKTADKSLTTLTSRLSEITDFIVGVGGSVKNILVNVDSAVVDVRNLVSTVNAGKGVLGALIADNKMSDTLKTMINNLTVTSKNAVIASSRLAENMEALKHNWLFKSYFEQRGYWDALEYEREIDAKLIELRNQNKLLDDRIKELLELEKRTEKTQK